MKLLLCLTPILVLAACAGGGPLPPRGDVSALATNRFVVVIDEETKISVRENGAVVFDKRVVARIDERGKVTDTRGQLLAWLHEDNVRLRGGVVLPIRTGNDGELHISRAAQDQAGVEVVMAQVGADGGIAASAERIPTMKIEGDRSIENRRMALLLLFMRDNKMLGESSSTEDTDLDAP